MATPNRAMLAGSGTSAASMPLTFRLALRRMNSLDSQESSRNDR